MEIDINAFDKNVTFIQGDRTMALMIKITLFFQYF